VVDNESSRKNRMTHCGIDTKSEEKKKIRYEDIKETAEGNNREMLKKNRG